MVFGIFKSEKSRNLAKYTRMIIKGYEHGSLDLKSMMQQGRDREDALEGFIDIALNDPNNKNTIKKYKINKKNLEAKFSMLVVNGAGVVARNHFVAASALVYKQTLIFLYQVSIYVLQVYPCLYQVYYQIGFALHPPVIPAYLSELSAYQPEPS